MKPFSKKVRVRLTGVSNNLLKPYMQEIANFCGIYHKPLAIGNVLAAK
jgi:hypothetical protein